MLFVVAAVAISILYRYGPSREHAKWRWVTWGGVLATALWLLIAWAFSWYLSNFANYNATYGSLGAVIGFMMWTWVSVVVLIMGAELDAEAEHQTAVDSTTGAERPMGERGATMADTLGRQRDASAEPAAGWQTASRPSNAGLKAPAASDRRPAATTVAGEAGMANSVAAVALGAVALAAGWYLALKDRARP